MTVTQRSVPMIFCFIINPPCCLQGLLNKFFFCCYPFLLNTQSKRWLLEKEAQIEQHQVVRQDMLQSLICGRPNMPYLVLRVNRSNLLETSIGQVSPFRKRPYRARAGWVEVCVNSAI